MAQAIRLLGAVVSFGKKNGRTDDNPFDGMAPEAEGERAVERRGFRPDELQRLFTSPVYTGCASPHRRLKPGSMVLKDALYWLPLLGANTGARLEEMGQALVSDVIDMDGALALALTTLDEDQLGRRLLSKQAGGKHLETETSKRVVPFHPVPLAAGFADYAGTLQGCGEQRPFPDLKPIRFGVLTAKLSKDFGRLLHSLELDDPGLVFHSLRHGF